MVSCLNMRYLVYSRRCSDVLFLVVGLGTPCHGVSLFARAVRIARSLVGVVAGGGAGSRVKKIQRLKRSRQVYYTSPLTVYRIANSDSLEMANMGS